MRESSERGMGSRSWLPGLKVMVVAVGLLVVPACDWATLSQGVDLHEVVAAELARKSGADVTIGAANLSWGGTLTLEQVEFGPGKDGALLSIPRLTWGLDLGRGWNSISSLATLTVEEPVMRVNRGTEKTDGADVLAQLIDPKDATLRPGQVQVRSGRVILQDFAEKAQEVSGLTLSADLSVPDLARFDASGTAPGETPFRLIGSHSRATSITELAITADRLAVGQVVLERVQAVLTASPGEVRLTSLTAGSVTPAGLALQAGPGKLTRSKKKAWTFEDMPAKIGNAPVLLSGHWGGALDHHLAIAPDAPGLSPLGMAGAGSMRADLEYRRTEKQSKLTGELALAGFDLPLTVKGRSIPTRLEKGTFRFKNGGVKSPDASFTVGTLALRPVIDVTKLLEKPVIAVQIPRTVVDLDHVVPYLDEVAARAMVDLGARGRFALEGKLAGEVKDPDFQGSLQIVDIRLDAPAAGGELRLTGGKLEHGEKGWTLSGGKLEREGVAWNLEARAIPGGAGVRVEGEAVAAGQSLREVLGEHGARLDPASTAKVDVNLAFSKEADSIDRRISMTPRGGKLRFGTRGPWIQLGKGGRLALDGGTITLDEVPVELSGRLVELTGRATPSGDGYALDGLKIRVAGQTLSGSGRVAVDPAQVDLDLASPSFDPTALAGSGKIALAGKLPLQLGIQGAPGDLKVHGQLSMAGARVKGPSFSTPVEVTSGTLRFTGSRAVLEGVKVDMGGTGFSVTGAIDDPLGGGRYDGVRLAGTVPFALLAPGSGLSGSGRLETTVTGSVSSPRVNGRLTAEEIVTSGTTIRDVSARVDTGKKGIVLEDFRAMVEGHRVTGRLIFPRNGKPEHDVDIHGLSVSSMGGGRGGVVEGTFQLSLAGSGFGSSLRSKGTLTSRDMVVHAQRIPQIAGARGKVKAGAVGAQLLGALLSNNNLGDLARAGGAQAAYYGELIDQLSGSHAMGPVRARVTIDPDTVTLNPIEGRRVMGRVTIDRSSDRMKGRLDRLMLGGVEISDVKIQGTVSDPDFDVDLDNVAMAGGRRPRGGDMGETLGGGLGIPGGGSVGENILGEVLRSRSRRGRRSRGGDVLGDLLGGGDEGRDMGSEIGGALLQQIFR